MLISLLHCVQSPSRGFRGLTSFPSFLGRDPATSTPRNGVCRGVGRGFRSADAEVESHGEAEASPVCSIARACHRVGVRICFFNSEIRNPKSVHGTGIPRIFSRIRYSELVAVMYRVFQSLSPQARFAALSGVAIVPRCAPAGLNTQMPPGPVT